MILDVTYRFTAKVLGARQRNPKDARFVHTIPLEIPEFSASERPVALRFTHNRMGGGVVPANYALRWDGENLFRPVIPESETDLVRDAGWLRHMAARGHEQDRVPDDPFRTATVNYQDRSELPEGSPFVSSGILSHPVDELPQGLRIHSSDKELVEAQVREAAARIMLVDGLVHQRCNEPIYAIAESGIFARDFYRFAAPEFYDSENDRNQNMRRIFRADEVEYMCESLQLNGIDTENRIEIVIPEAVRHDAPNRLLLQETERLQQWYESRIAGQDVDFFGRFAALRDGNAAYTAERKAAGAGEKGLRPVHVAPGALAQVLRDTLDAADWARTEPGREAEPSEFQFVRTAFERLDARSLSQDFDVGPGI